MVYRGPFVHGRFRRGVRKYADFGSRTDIVAAGTPTAATNRWHFSGKEDQDVDFGLPYTDFGARLYSPGLGRWIAPDPASEKYYDLSPYAYCANNPVNLVDPDGRFPHILVGGIIGGVVSGGVALYQGKTGRELWGAVAGGFVFGAITTATGGANLASAGGWAILDGAIGGAIGGLASSTTEQLISTGTIDVGKTITDGIAGTIAGGASTGISCIIKKGSGNAISAIEKNYSSDSVQKALRKEVKNEFNNAGRTIGHSTQKELNVTVAERTQTLMDIDKALVNGVSKVVDETQQQVVEWGTGEIAVWIYDKLHE